MATTSSSSLAASTVSEESPLYLEKRKSPSSRSSSSSLRRRSSAERIIVGIKQAMKAFEYEVLSKPSVDEDEFEISERESFEDEHPGNGETSNNHHDLSSSSSSRCRIFLSIVCILCILFVVVGLPVGFSVLSESTDRGFNVEWHTCTDPIMALKDSASLEGLQNGAVAADQEVCSKIGNSILVNGGNAVDAAVATALCLGVANPASSGIGGGAFILIHSDRVNFERRSKDIQNFPDFHDKRDPNFLQSEDKVTEVIDCRETAPAAATEDMFLSEPDDAASFGGLSVAIPGELRGLELAHARHGRLPWADVVKPAIEIARDGLVITKSVAQEIEYAARASKKYGEYPMLRRFLTKDDTWETHYKEGDVLKNPNLAKTLEQIAAMGSDGYYDGEVAQNLSKDVQAAGGILTVDDLHNYRPTLRTPVVGDANGFRFVGVPPPSSGGAAIIGAARFLSGYASPLSSAADTLSVHRIVEAFRHVFAIRMALSDPEFNMNKTKRAVDDLTVGSFMESLRQATRDNDTLPLSMYGGRWAQFNDTEGQKAAADAHEGDRRLLRSDRQRKLYRPFGYLEDKGTSHFSVWDKDGNAVSMTSSVNQIFGSFVFSQSTGVLLGDTMDDFGNPGRSNFFGLKPAKENFIAPGKKPLSSMSPTMVFRRDEGSDDSEFGKLALVVGGSGGPKIITAVLQVVVGFCFLGRPLFDAVAQPRVHDQLLYHDTMITTTENSRVFKGPVLEVSNRTKEALLKRGHDSLLDIDYAGTVQAIAIDFDTGTLSAVSDIRKGGKPAGH